MQPPRCRFFSSLAFLETKLFFLASGQPSAFNSQLVKKVLETFPVKNEDFTKEKFKASIKSQQNNKATGLDKI